MKKLNISIRNAKRSTYLSSFLVFFFFCYGSFSDIRSSNLVTLDENSFSLQVVEKTYKQVFEEIRSKTDYVFFFRDDAINLQEKVSIDTDNLTVEETLDKLFEKTGNSYKIEGRQVFISKGEKQSSKESSSSGVSANQQNTISIGGVVRDVSGQVAIGASVIVKGTTRGAITDVEGKFSLVNIPKNSVIEISYIGYQSQTVTARVDNNSYVIILEESYRAIDEIVVVGYGTQKKVNLTGSVVAVDGKRFESRPITNVSVALAGLVPGLAVRQSTGEPGSDGASLRIRGEGSLGSGSGPLVIVDGMESNMNHINPQDIESISILKDAASGAIYGSRAANGVILITTKKGTKGQTKITFEANLSFAKPTKKPKFINDYITYMGFINEAATNIGDKEYFSQSDIDLWAAANANPNGISPGGYPNYVAYPNTDWYDTIFETNLMQTYNVGVNGASDRASYNVSLRYQNNPGIIMRSGLETYQARINLELKVTDFLSVGTQSWFSTQSRGPADMDRSGLFNWMRQTTPGVYPKYEDMYGHKVAPGESGTINNPIENMERARGKNETKRLFTTWYAKLNIVKGLTFESKVNYTQNVSDRNTYNMSNPRWDFAAGIKVSTENDPSSATSTYRTDKDYRITTDNVLRYQATFNKDHDIEALVGHNEYYFNSSYFSATGEGLLDHQIPSLSTTALPRSVAGSSYDYSMRSFFGRINYAYKSRYLLEVNMRNDGSSRFRQGRRWGVFPSASVGWRVSEEGFVGEQFKDVFQNFKLRLSYGKLGNNSIGNYKHMNSYVGTGSASYYSFGGEAVPLLKVNDLGNPNIRWESTNVFDVGIDAIFLKGRASIELDYYDKYTNDILYAPDIPGVMGRKTPPTMNLAAVRNKGFEMTAGWNDKIRDFSYGLKFNVAYNKNKVERYKGKLVEGWVTDENGKEVWRSNYSGVATGSNNAIVEGHSKNEYRNLLVYQGTGTYFHSDGTVDVNGGPKKGMIRTKEDMDWLQAMQAAGHRFLPQNNVGKNQLYYGDLIFADVNGDGIYGDPTNDKAFMGKDTTPKWNMGINLDLAYKGFDFSMLWQGSFNVLTYDQVTGYHSNQLRHGWAVPKDIVENRYFFDPDNPDDPRTNINGTYPRLKLGADPINESRSNFWLQSVSFMRLKNVQLGYTLPSSIANKLLLANARFYLSGENLLTLTSYKGIDPETRAYDAYPSLKQFSFGLNLTF